MFQTVRSATRTGLAAALIAGAWLTAPVAPAEAQTNSPLVQQTADQKIVRRYVVDQANMLSRDAEMRLTKALANFRGEQGKQVVVVTVASLKGQDISDVSAYIAQQWGVAVDAREPGLLAVIAPNDQVMKLYAGPGLTDWMQPTVTQHLIQDYFTPSFAAGDLEGGVLKGIAGTLAVLAQPNPIRSVQTASPEQAAALAAGTPVSATAAASGTSGGFSLWWLMLVPLLGLLAAAALVGRKMLQAGRFETKADRAAPVAVAERKAPSFTASPADA